MKPKGNNLNGERKVLLIPLTSTTIRQTVKKLPQEEHKRGQIERLAIDLSARYLNTLTEAEERTPIDIALSAIYLSCHRLGMPITQLEISRYSSRSLLGWPSVTEDMAKRTPA